MQNSLETEECFITQPFNRHQNSIVNLGRRKHKSALPPSEPVDHDDDSLENYPPLKLGEPGRPGTRDLELSLRKLSLLNEIDESYRVFRQMKGLPPSKYTFRGIVSPTPTTSSSIDDSSLWPLPLLQSASPIHGANRKPLSRKFREGIEIIPTPFLRSKMSFARSESCPRLSANNAKNQKNRMQIVAESTSSKRPELPVVQNSMQKTFFLGRRSTLLLRRAPINIVDNIHRVGIKLDQQIDNSIQFRHEHGLNMVLMSACDESHSVGIFRRHTKLDSWSQGQTSKK